MNLIIPEAQRRDENDILSIQKALDAYAIKVKKDIPAVEEDLLFHLQIAEASKNSVLKSLMLIITQDIVNSFIKLDVCKDGRFYKALAEHKIIVKHIINKEPEEAVEAMRNHLGDVMDYNYQLKREAQNQNDQKH